MIVTVIGHGESPKGCGWGKKIDENVVIRLKCPNWQNAEDYGRRLDYCVSSTETMMVMLDEPRIPKQYWCQPKRGSWNKHTETSFKARAKAEVRICLDIHLRWNPIFRSISTKTFEECGNHSIGMAAITYACEFLKPQTILLVGFDNMLDPDRMDYFKANKGKWTTRHDWHAEKKMLPMIEEAYGAEIRRFE